MTAPKVGDRVRHPDKPGFEGVFTGGVEAMAWATCDVDTWTYGYRGQATFAPADEWQVIPPPDDTPEQKWPVGSRARKTIVREGTVAGHYHDGEPCLSFDAADYSYTWTAEALPDPLPTEPGATGTYFWAGARVRVLRTAKAEQPWVDVSLLRFSDEEMRERDFQADPR